MEFVSSGLVKKWHNIGIWKILTLEEDVVVHLFKEGGFTIRSLLTKTWGRGSMSICGQQFGY